MAEVRTIDTWIEEFLNGYIDRIEARLGPMPLASWFIRELQGARVPFEVAGNARVRVDDIIRKNARADPEGFRQKAIAEATPFIKGLIVEAHRQMKAPEPAAPAYPYPKETGPYLRAEAGNAAVERDIDALRQVMHEVSQIDDYKGKSWREFLPVVEEHLANAAYYQEKPDRVAMKIRVGLAKSGYSALETWEAIQLLKRRAKQKSGVGRRAVRNKTLVQGPAPPRKPRQKRTPAQPPEEQQTPPDWPFDSVPPERRLLPPPERKLLPPPQEMKLLPRPEERKLIGPGGQHLLGPGGQHLLGPGGQHLLPPGRQEPAPEPQQQRPEKVKLVIESQPMLQVPVTINKIVSPPGLTSYQFMRYVASRFPLRDPNTGRRNPLPRQIVRIYDDYKLQNFSKDEREKAEKWLGNQLKSVGLRSPEGVVEFILENDFDTKREKLDKGGVVLEGSGRWRPRGYNLLPFGDNLKTALYIDMEPATYLISVPSPYSAPFYHGQSEGQYTFVGWHIYRPSAGAANPIVIEGKNEIEIELNEPLRLIAFYHKAATHTDRTTSSSPYQGGRDAANNVAVFGDTAARGFNIPFLRERRQYDLMGREMKKVDVRNQNPFLNAAINKGKRTLNGYAKAEFSRVFDPLRDEYRRRAQELRQQERTAKDARRELNRIIRQNMRAAGGLRSFTRLIGSDEDKVNIADRMTAPGGALPGNVALIASRDRLREYLEARDKYTNDFKRDLEGASAHLADYLKNKAITISVGIARRYRLPLNSPEENALKEQLVSYSGEIAEDFATRGRTIGFAFVRGLTSLSRSTQTFGGAWNNFLYNVWSFIFGPWTIGSIFVVIQFAFVITYLGYSIQLLWILPTISAVFVFILNFAETSKPFDWITHFASGAMIGYSAEILLLALNFVQLGTVGFWITWAVLVFVGVFQFYNVD